MSSEKHPVGLPSEEMREAISALLDGALSPNDEARVRGRIAESEECQAYFSELKAIDAKLRLHLDQPCYEEELWAGVQSRIHAGRRTNSLRRGRAYQVAAAAVLLVGLFIGGWQYMGADNGAGSFQTALVEDFDSYLRTGNVLDIEAEHDEAILRWMNSRVEFPLPTAVSSPSGFHIAGGRLCSFLGRKAAFFSYRDQARDVGLYVTRSEGLQGLPGDGSVKAIEFDDGFAIVMWRHGELAFVTVSKLPIGDLANIAAHFRDARPSRS